MFCRVKLRNEEKPEKRIKTKRNIKLILISIIVLIVIVGMFTYTKFFSAKENILTSISQQNKSSPIWPMFQYDERRTGQCPYDTSMNNGTLKWKFKTDGMVQSSPAIGSDGTIYVGSNDDYLYALNPDGTLKWKFKTDGWIRSSPAIGSDGTIYVGSNDDYLYALNPDGTLKWKFKTIKEIDITSPLISSDGTLYVGSSDGYLYALNPDGTLKWKFKTDGWIRYSPAISQNGTIYVVSDGNFYIYAINPDGTLKWKLRMTLINTHPVIGSGETIYLSGNFVTEERKNHLYAIHSSEYFEIKFESYDIIGYLAIDSKNNIYIGTVLPSGIYAIDSEGTLKWKFDTYGAIGSNPVIASERTIYWPYENCLYAINPDGTLKWEFITSEEIQSSPVISSDGTIYVGSNDGYLYAISGK